MSDLNQKNTPSLYSIIQQQLDVLSGALTRIIGTHLSILSVKELEEISKENSYTLFIHRAGFTFINITGFKQDGGNWVAICEDSNDLDKYEVPVDRLTVEDRIKLLQALEAKIDKVKV